VPLWSRLDELVEQANHAGASTNRAELIAAWLVSETPTAEVMRQRVEAYRGMRVRDAVVDGGIDGKSRIYSLRQAGRPRGT